MAFDWGSALGTFAQYAPGIGKAVDDAQSEKFKRQMQMAEMLRQAQRDELERRQAEQDLNSGEIDLADKQAKSDLEKNSRAAVTSVSSDIAGAEKYRNFMGPPTPDAIGKGNDFTQSKSDMLTRPLGYALGKLAPYSDTSVAKSYLQPMLDTDKSQRDAEEAKALQAQQEAAAMERARLNEQGANYRASLNEQGANFRAGLTKANTPKTPNEGRPLSSEAAKTLGLISSGLQGAQDFRDALTNGDETFWATTMLGGFSNPKAAIAFEKATESLGRLNSGGAINKEEEKRFKKLVADKKALVTPEGRAAIAEELRNFVERGKSTGDLIYGGSDWQSKFGVSRKEYGSVQEAEAANLPKGTEIYINGRKAVVE